MITKLEHADITATSGSFQRQFECSFGVPSELKSIVRISASSSTRSGRTAAARQYRNRRAYPWIGFLISLSIRSYGSTRLSGNSFRICGMSDGRLFCRTSSWQNAQLNLIHILRFAYKQMKYPYIPSTLSSSIVIARSLSSSRHPRIIWFE